MSERTDAANAAVKIAVHALKLAGVEDGVVAVIEKLLSVLTPWAIRSLEKGESPFADTEVMMQAAEEEARQLESLKFGKGE